MANTDQTPRLPEYVLQLNGKNFLLATPEQAKGQPGIRQWTVTKAPAQDGEWPPEQEIKLQDFGLGAGYTFQGPDGTYDRANGWDASAPGVIATWPQLTTCQSFTSDDVRGWVFQMGQYVYVARGRWVVKYAIDDTSGVTWPILEIHDLGSGNDVAGRPDLFNQKYYVPVSTSSTGQPFHELSAQATPTTGVQTVTISGSPTGGSYTLTWNGNTTSVIAYNAPQATVQAALQALPGLWLATVSTSGTSPNYTHTVTMTAAGATLAGSAVGAITATSSLTGGSSPAVTPAVTTAGVGDTWNAGPSDRTFRCFRAFQYKLYGAKGNMVYSCDASPLVDGNWSPVDGAGYEVGDPGLDITDLSIYLQYLLVSKENGAFSFDTNLNTVNEVPDVQDIIDTLNGVGAEYSNGYVYVPNRIGLFHWSPGTYSFVGPNQEGSMDSALSPGWGRVAGLAPFGKYLFVSANDITNGIATISSILPGTQTRQPIIPHVHQSVTGTLEGMRVVSSFTQAPGASGFTTFADNAGTGSETWTIPAGGPTVSDPATVAAGDSHYLMCTGLVSPNIPASATITGVTVSVTRNAGA